MRLDVLATGSTGNCTAVRADGLFLIDCGKQTTWICQQLKYELPDAILLTHEHSDHSRAVTNFLKRGVDIFTTQSTADALDLHRHNLNIIKAGDSFNVCGVNVEVLPSVHDAAEPVNFILSDVTDRVLYVTDTNKPPDVTGTFTKIFIEANYSVTRLLTSDINERQRHRILTSHLSFEQARRFLREHPCGEIHLLHTSKRHGDCDEFYRLIQQ